MSGRASDDGDPEVEALLERTLGGAGAARASPEEARRAAERFLAAAAPRSRARRVLPFAVAAALLLAGPVVTRFLGAGGGGSGAPGSRGSHSPPGSHGSPAVAGGAGPSGASAGGAATGGVSIAAAGIDGTSESDGGSDVRVGTKAAAGGAVVAIAAGVITGSAWLGDGPQAGAAGAPGGAGAAAGGGRADLLARAEAAERRAADLEEKLARAQSEKGVLEERLDALAKGGPVRVRMGGPPPGGAHGGDALSHGPASHAPGVPGSGAGAPGAAPLAVSLPADASPDQKVDALVKAFDWDAAAAAMAKIADGRKGGPHKGMGGFGDPAVRLEMSRLELALAEISKALGATDPEAALSDLRVQEALMSARLRAYGAALDARQRSLLRDQLARRRSQAQAEPAPRTIAERALRVVKDDLALEEELPSILTPEQYAEWVEKAGLDPFVGKHWPRMVMGIDESGDPSRELAQEWGRRFQIGEGGRRALADITRRFADGMLATPPVAKTLPPAERRLAVLRRTVRTLEVQVACERELATEQTFTPEERARTENGLGGLFEIVRGGPGMGGPGEED